MSIYSEVFLLKKKIRYARFAITPYCNFKCKHCYISNSYYNILNKPLLSIDEIINIISQLEELGVIIILLTGGEPLLHKNFNEIWEYIYKKGIRTILFTNGSLIDDDIIKILLKYPPLEIDFSLYGFYENTYNKFVGIEGACNKVYNSLKLLSKFKIPVLVKYITTKINKEDIDDAYVFIKKLQNIEFRAIVSIDPCINSLKKIDNNLKLSINDSIDILWKYHKNLLKEDFKFRNEHRSNYFYHCKACYGSLVIDPFGAFSFCDYTFEEFCLDIRKNTLKEGFNKIIPRWVRSQNIKYKIPKQCINCESRIFCNNCPQTARLETGDKEGINLYYHFLAKGIFDKCKAFLSKKYKN